MYGSLDISVSGMVAQRMRLNTIASNLANSSTMLDEHGEPNPYRRRFVVFQPGDPAARTEGGKSLGVHVAEVAQDQGEFTKRWDPGNPYAKPEGHPDAGYVYLPNVDTTFEQIDQLDAERAYEANVAAAEASKAMLAQALRILA